MSEWTPKVGDKVMVGEHGSYRVTWVSRQGELASLSDADGRITSNIPCYWLTPAPEPEPDEPTAPGALVRDGEGDLVALGDDLTDEPAWVVLTGDLCGGVVRWSGLPRPITVVIAWLRERIDKSRGLTLEDVTPSTPNALLALLAWDCGDGGRYDVWEDQ